MASKKSETTLNDADKAVQARQDGPAPFEQKQDLITRDKCKSFNYFYLH
jgi:hypothetical protein